MAPPQHLPFDAPRALYRLHGPPHETVTCFFSRLPAARLPQRLDYLGFGHGLSFLISGSGIITNPQGERCPVGPGRFFRFVNGQASVMEYHGGEDFVECGVYLQPQAVGLLTALGCLRPGPTVTAVRDPALVVREFRAVHRLLGSGNLGNPAVFSAVTALFELAEQQDAALAADGALEQARFRLGQDLDQRLALPAVAVAVGMSYRVLHKRFLQAYGVTLGGYRIRCRLAEAKRLLARHSVKATAARLGYPDPFTFSKQFQLHVGMSPAMYQGAGMAVLGSLSAR